MAAYGYKVALLFACALNITGQLYNYYWDTWKGYPVYTSC